MTTKTTDLGMAICAHIEGHYCEHFDAEGNSAGTSAEIEIADCEDPNNLTIVMDDGSRFRVSIFSE